MVIISLDDRQFVMIFFLLLSAYISFRWDKTFQFDQQSNPRTVLYRPHVKCIFKSCLPRCKVIQQGNIVTKEQAHLTIQVRLWKRLVRVLEQEHVRVTNESLYQLRKVAMQNQALRPVGQEVGKLRATSDLRNVVGIGVVACKKKLK